MKTLITLFLALFLLANCSNETDVLVQEWEAEGFNTPECVVLDKVTNVLFVSNIGGTDPKEKNGAGFISKLNLDGSVQELNWVGGLNAPKGMAILNEQLIVTDIDRVVTIDIAKGEIINEIMAVGAVFLNDVEVIGEDSLLISDSRVPNLYLYTNNSIKPILSDTSFTKSNGICVDGEKILVGVGDRIIDANIADSTWTDYILETGLVDGFSKVDEGVYLISDWRGRIHMVYTNKEKVLVLDTTKEEINAADFYYDKGLRRVYLPTFSSNKVICYKLL